MAYHIWRVGLDIQNGFMRALAVQRRRYGWQLRHWWQFPLPGDTLRAGSLHHTEALCETLLKWRRLLPRHISLRVGFPAQLILQQRLPAPDSRLQEPERGWYIENMAARKLPVSSDSLAIDYREDPHSPGSLVITAARRSELNHWLDCLRSADLHPEVVDVSTSAIRCMADAAGLEYNRLFLHRLADGWLWISPLNHPFQFGVIDPDEVISDANVLSLVSARYLPDVDNTAYYSSTLPDLANSAADVLKPWSPLTAFNQMQPPLPDFPSAFVIAGGLAVRPGDC
ncbi:MULTISPECIES: pilus assembly protein PilM [unclassified Brenneria]|uniref:pilus assembly protein PilM n=1 Tax=unclassified Brenneria TaxID=2634434 RepID=UPI001557AB0C|nr:MULTISPECIES: pilus assembly protein PilM [unclassified Brenneria]MBJ7222972.1 pilus assembly protein PilM [Brenneria sp. L3-3C-1]MEE3644211.1 pilus assembly protein PilM [Brenneria sp. L3_3C_1]MEE3652435.1 pilus assembly protein PilM [Brenneria sp. HEZEL_4_2_4]NPD02392.1 pilus assembly protein PilM [Brenneria sp. hezel4-2-4]